MNPRLALLPAVVLLGGLSACHTEDPTTVHSLGTVGSVYLSGPTTLRPAVEVTVDATATTGSVPPGVLFGGDPCTALTADDFAAVNIAGLGRGSLADSSLLSPDTCGYSVEAGRSAFVIQVSARTADEFAHPELDGGTAIEPVSGIGLAAVAYVRADGNHVLIVQVSNGYFSVRGPDADSVAALAELAVDNAAG